MTRITSRKHPLVQMCRRLGAGRGDAGDVLLDGEHLLEDALSAGVHVRAVLARDVHSPAVRRARDTGADVHDASAEALDAASPVRSGSGIVAIAQWQPVALEQALTAGRGVTLALVDVQDPGNVGSVIRSADALGGAAVIAVGATADPAGWKALRGAMGSTFRVPVSRATLDQLVARARAIRAHIVATTVGEGEALDRARFDAPTIILLGNEGAGLPDEATRHAQSALHVPMRPGVNSLNVAVTAALILYEAGRVKRTRSGASS